MKSVLMIGYWFPPDGSAGVYRLLRFIRLLPTMGWSPTVIAADLNRYTCSRYDPGLLDLVPHEADVVRVKLRDLWHLLQGVRSKWLQEEIASSSSESALQIRTSLQTPPRALLRDLIRKVEAWFYHPDPAMTWIRPAVKASLRLCARISPDVIWATAGPVSSLIVAERISRRTGVPYVLDFRDAWTITFNEFEERRPAWARRSDQRNMYKLLRGAQSVVFLYDTMAECYLRAYPGALDSSRIHIIPNGFEGNAESIAAPRAGKQCNILYTGTLSDYRFDTLLQAIHILKETFPNEGNPLRFHFIGEGTELVGDQASALGLDDCVTVCGPVTQQDVTRLSREANALLLLGRPPGVRGYELFAAAKLFGYLKSGRPILAVLPPDEAKKILLRVGVSTIANVDSIPDIVELLRKLSRLWAANDLDSLIPNPDACEAFSAKRQTEALVQALEGKPPSDPYVAGTADIPPSLHEQIDLMWQTHCSSSRAERASAVLAARCRNHLTNVRKSQPN